MLSDLDTAATLWSWLFMTTPPTGDTPDKAEINGYTYYSADIPGVSTLEDMQEYIKDNRMSDYQDHHYPSEMSVDAMIQTYLLDTGDNAKEKFLKKFDSDWERYNRDLIREVQDYQKEQEDAK